MDRLVKEYIMLDPATAAWAEQVKNGTARCVGREVINMDDISETVSAISVDSMMIEIRRIDGSGNVNTALGNYLAPNAIIRIWSCDAASTYEKCAGLQNAANELNAEIYAKTGEVSAGPDGGPIVQGIDKIAAWIVGNDASTWKVFKPKPMSELWGLPYRNGPSAYKIRKREVHLK